MVNHQAYINTIQNLTGDGTSKELASFCRKWIDENGEKLTAVEADRIVSALTNSEQKCYTLGIVCALIAKLTKMKTDADFLEYLRTLQAHLIAFDAKQLHWAPDIYDRLFDTICQMLIRKNMPIYGISLLESAILVFTHDNPTHLTNLHTNFLCLCLKARHFERARPFLHVDVIGLFKQTDGSWDAGQQNTDKFNGGVSSSEAMPPHQSSGTISSFFQKAVNTVSGTFGVKSDEPKQTQPLFKRRSVLLYFYYGAMVYGALEEWENAILFLEHAICLPTKKPSAIVLEALKKYILISLILGRKKPLENLPNYRNPVLHRNFVSLAAPYMKIQAIIQKSTENKTNLVAALTTYLDEKRGIFDRDQNVGLVKVLINACKENAVKRLGNIFVSLQMSDVCRMANLPFPTQLNTCQEDAEQIILRLRRNGCLNAQIDDRTQTVVFEELGKEDVKATSTDHSKTDIDAAMAEIIELARTIRAFDGVIRVNPQFIEKSMQKGKERIPGGNGGQGSSLIYPEDEGFTLTGSP